MKRRRGEFVDSGGDSKKTAANSPILMATTESYFMGVGDDPAVGDGRHSIRPILGLSKNLNRTQPGHVRPLEITNLHSLGLYGR